MLSAGGQQGDFDHAARIDREFLLPSNIRTGIVSVMAIRVHAGEQPLEGVADPRAGSAAAVGSDRAQSDAGVGPNQAATRSLLAAKVWPGIFRVITTSDLQSDIPRNRWICAEFMVKHKTPGLPDGEQAFWTDGELRGHRTRNPTNIVTFDNVVIARAYIGPSRPPQD